MLGKRSEGRRPRRRFWAWALAVVILVVGFLISLPAFSIRRHAPQPLLDFFERSGPGGQLPR